jgi:DNA-binding IclR family transcriptional regulator
MQPQHDQRALLVAAKLLERRGTNLTAITARSQLPMSTVHRLATELTAWGVLDRATDGCYRADHAPGHAIARAVRALADQEITGDAAPIMEDVFRVTNAPVRVGYLDGTAVSYIEKVSVRKPVSEISPAPRLPARATALGKVLLAFAPPDTRDAFPLRELRRFTPYTVTDPEELRSALRRIRTTRVATSDRELVPERCAVATPVFGVGENTLILVIGRTRASSPDPRSADRDRHVLAASGPIVTGQSSWPACHASHREDDAVRAVEWAPRGRRPDRRCAGQMVQLSG